MALSPINPTQLTPPRVALIDERSGAISREWYRFFLSLLTSTQSNQEETTLGPDTASLLATYDAMLASATQASEVASDGMVASLESSLNNLQNAFGVTPPNLSGTVTSVAASGGTTGLTFTGSPITTSGTLTLGGTLVVANGGTGQTSYTDGQLLIGNTTGNTLTKATLIAGSGVSITNGAGSISISATGSGGTVTSVSVVSANGFAGTVATATTTPAITLSTSVTGLVKGNGTALSAAVAATDYVAPSAYASANGLTMATSRLLGRTTASTGAAEEISVAGGLTLSAGVLTGTSGTVTSVTGTSPVVSSGGATPAISMPAATTSVNGYLTSTDWTTFNNKGSGSVTSVSGTGTVNGITLTGTVTTSGSLTLGGTLSGVSLTSQVTGTLPVANGGTGTATAFTAGSVVFAGASGTYSQDNANLFWNDTDNRLGIGTSTPGYAIDIASSDTTATLGYAIRIRANVTAAAGAIQFTDSGVTAQWGFLAASATGVTLQADGTSVLRLNTNSLTRFQIGASGQFGIGGATYGTSGQVLTSGGASAAPTWSTPTTGTVTSVSGTGTVNGITLTGTVTSTGSLTLGGTLSGVSLTTQVSGTLPVANGGTGATTLTGYVKGSGTSAFTASASVPAADVSGLATVATSGSFNDLSNKPGIRSNGQNVITSSKTLGSADNGTNILILTSGITITFPASGFSSGHGFAISNVSGGNVTLSTPGGADFGATLPNNGTFFAFCDGGGFWRQYCYSTSRL
jgi:hypothetical protein